MKVQVIFGLTGGKHEVNWWKGLHDFPKLISYKGKNWEWLMYDEDKSKRFDYFLTYTEIPSYDPNFKAEVPKFEIMFTIMNSRCECGSSFTDFQNIHMFFCPMWKKNP